MAGIGLAEIFRALGQQANEEVNSAEVTVGQRASYRMAAESLLVRQGLRATGGDGSHMAVEDAVSAQFGADIPAFAKATFERLRRTRHTAQYFDPAAAPITKPDASWAIEKATAALSNVKALLAASPPERFN